MKFINWSRSKIITALKEYPESPSTRKVPPRLYQACLRYFGGFNKAKLAAGLTISKPKHHQLKSGAEKLDENLGYVLGAVYGDGHFRVRRSPRRTSGEIRLKVRDLDFAQEFRKRLRMWSGIQPALFIDNRDFFVVDLSSIDAAKVIKKFHLKRILRANKAVRGMFLKGLFDAEGGVTGRNLDNRRFSSRWIYFCNSDLKIIKTVCKLLEDFGITFKIRRVKSGFGSERPQYQLMIFRVGNFEKFYKMIGFSIKRKLNKLRKVIYSYEKYKNIKYA